MSTVPLQASNANLKTSASALPETSGVSDRNQTEKNQNEKSANGNVLSVEQLNRQIRQLIEGQIPIVWIRAELSNFKAHSSGHFYFSLKDASSQIRAVMFRGHNSKIQFKPADGMEVLVRGRITVYEPRGEYQIACDMMEPVGAGALQKAFEQLKEKLRKEGLFDSARKRPLPILPRHVALVTSPTGAAIRDMMNVLSRRNRTVAITLVPTIVQGDGAALQICRALEMAFRLPELDAVIVGRGGGSIEDLWAFNDENLARLIARSPVPIISAVGHEIDFTIADFVADVRAPTPSAAAELVVQSASELAKQLNAQTRVLTQAFYRRLQLQQQMIKQIDQKLVDPRRKLQDHRMRNDELLLRLAQGQKRHVLLLNTKLSNLSLRLKSPKDVLERKRDQLQNQLVRLSASTLRRLDQKKARFAKDAAALDALSPLKVLERGYAVAMQGSKIVKSRQDLDEKQTMRVLVHQLEIETQILNVKERKPDGF